MKTTNVDAKSRRMLELLADGASTRLVAKKMGYSPGTVRVYLHNLYKVLGVRNRTEAVIWYMNEQRGPERAQARATLEPWLAEETFGDVALREGLLGALGVMESFLGPFGRVWEVGLRLKGTTADESLLSRRAQARPLWRALLAGDFALAKRLHDAGEGERLIVEAPSEAVLLVMLLLAGGYSNSGDRALAMLGRKRKSGRGISNRELVLLRSLRQAMESAGEAGLAALYPLAAEGAGRGELRHLAMVALFHAYRARKDADRARATANAIWAEAEAVRRQLEAMGVRPLSREVPVPGPGKAAVKAAVAQKEKAAAA